ncbi:hypothetical protein [Nitrosopumilus adriaticus]|uniref:hypothetical protein n=1 Tax=Nitrosopumilus adriaticus TaxID=1580092 RepID=UPI000B26EFEB|nr:hypothetical protein [Nitrosopumilus adriaticus]
MERECMCIAPKKHRLIFDGGEQGQYSISLCEKCNSEEDRQFLIYEEAMLQ